MTRAFLSKFKVSSAWGTKRSHSHMEKFLSTPARIAKTWFLNVRIARSAALRQWTYGGTSWYLMLFFANAHLSLFEASLSMIYIFGCDPERASCY